MHYYLSWEPRYAKCRLDCTGRLGTKINSAAVTFSKPETRCCRRSRLYSYLQTQNPAFQESAISLNQMAERKATIHRKTNETQIDVSIDLDCQPGASSQQIIDISTGIGFLDHVRQQSLPFILMLSRPFRCTMRWPSTAACRSRSKQKGTSGSTTITQLMSVLYYPSLSCGSANESLFTQDTAIALGSAFKAALGEVRGIRRYGTGFAPLDEVRTPCLPQTRCYT